MQTINAANLEVHVCDFPGDGSINVSHNYSLRLLFKTTGWSALPDSYY